MSKLTDAEDLLHYYQKTKRLTLNEARQTNNSRLLRRAKELAAKVYELECRVCDELLINPHHLQGNYDY